MSNSRSGFIDLYHHPRLLDKSPCKIAQKT